MAVWAALLSLTIRETVSHIRICLRALQIWYRCIALPVAMPLNCSGMYRGIVRDDGVSKTAIFDDDELD